AGKDGLSVNAQGQLTGRPTTAFSGNDEEKTVNVPVRLERTGDRPVDTVVPVTVLRDTDGDGTPDKTDTDDDNDGILDGADTNPKAVDALSARLTPQTVVDKRRVTPVTVVTPNKPGSMIASTATNGLSVNVQGQLVGTPTGVSYRGDAETATVTIPVTVTNPADRTPFRG
ncbi:hypothetical protein ACMZ6Z_09580, partial [Streptococcus pluranimalium]